jgi:hemoglobin
MTTEASLYNRVGGADTLRTVTELFCQKALADDLLAYYFAPVDVTRQASMLAEFLALAFGGPGRYSGLDLRSAHARLPGLSDEHFDRVVSLLAAALRETGTGEDDVRAAALAAETVRAEVLNR